MRRAPIACVALVLLVSGCSQPGREIVSTFRAFLRDVEAGDTAKVEATAPFLAGLEAQRRARALAAFDRLARERLELSVAPGAHGTYLLKVSVRSNGESTVIPFRRTESGRWQMSAVLEAVQHIDVIPAAPARK